MAALASVGDVRRVAPGSSPEEQGANRRRSPRLLVTKLFSHTPKDKQMSKHDAIRKAAEQGDAAAQFELAGCYLQGDGVDRNLAEAARWLRRAAEQGLADAQYLLGVGYYNGDIVEQNPVAAVKWFRRAADQGYGRAQAVLASCYMAGIGVEQDPDQGLYWSKRAAESLHE